VKNLNADLFINNNSPNVDVENPNLLHETDWFFLKNPSHEILFWLPSEL
jgi:hypothetical protein